MQGTQPSRTLSRLGQFGILLALEPIRPKSKRSQLVTLLLWHYRRLSHSQPRTTLLLAYHIVIIIKLLNLTTLLLWHYRWIYLLTLTTHLFRLKVRCSYLGPITHISQLILLTRKSRVPA